MARSLLHKHNPGHYSLNHLEHTLLSLYMNLTLKMTNHVADPLFCLTDQQLTWINKLGSTSARRGDQSCILQHGQDLFPVMLLS